MSVSKNVVRNPYIYLYIIFHLKRLSSSPVHISLHIYRKIKNGEIQYYLVYILPFLLQLCGKDHLLMIAANANRLHLKPIKRKSDLPER